jgi:hypothetical protein
MVDGRQETEDWRLKTEDGELFSKVRILMKEARSSEA